MKALEIEFPQFYYQKCYMREDQEIIAAETSIELDKKDHLEEKRESEKLKPDHLMISENQRISFMVYLVNI